MRCLKILLILFAYVNAKRYSLDDTDSIVMACNEPVWLSISSSPDSGFIWYSPSNEYIKQQDQLGFYKSGSQYFNIRCSSKAEAGATYYLNFYYVDAAYEAIYTQSLAINISKN